MTTTQTLETKMILERAAELETEKCHAISRLIQERQDLTASTEARLKAIKAELHALGHRVARPRKAK